MPVVSARVRRRNGRANRTPSRSTIRGIPASESSPEDRSTSISTVSAWSSPVWASSTHAADSRRAVSASARYRASRAAASTP